VTRSAGRDPPRPPSCYLPTVNAIALRLEGVRARITRAAEACGRDSASVRLLAVSKTKPAADIREAYAAGQRDFGENYVQEMTAKAAELADLPDLRWHMIGHLQRNKVRQIASFVSAIHTVDSVRLAEELGRRLEGRALPEAKRLDATDPRLPVLVEVNVAGETQKSGCAPGDLDGVLTALDAQPSLRSSGLMTVPPHTEDPARARPFFDALVALRDRHGGATRLPELSMGMTHDLEHAIAAGATWVRVGTAIFGERVP
jgi:PLP dependent protein